MEPVGRARHADRRHHLVRFADRGGHADETGSRFLEFERHPLGRYPIQDLIIDIALDLLAQSGGVTAEHTAPEGLSIS